VDELTLAGTPSARSVLCNPDGSLRSRIVILMSPSACLATVQAASIFTGQQQRDEHLRTNDFLDVPNNPTLTLVGKGLKKVDDTNWVISTDLTIRGITKSVDFDLEFLGEGDSMQEGKSVVAFSASATIDRRDFGVSFNHSLLDGNKRLSWATTLAFYAINGYDLRPTNNAVTFVRGVAAGTVPLADAATWLKSHARPFNDDWTKARPIRPAPARHFRLP